MNGGGIYNSVGAQHLAPTRLPAITRDHDFYEVDCYDFKWIDQIRTDLKTRPAITFVSRGTKVRPDFIKNLQLTVKEFARPVGYNVDSRFGKSYLSKEDDLLSVLSFVDPRYVLPIFRTDKLDGMIFQYRLVSAKQAEGMHLVLFADMFVFLCDDPNKVLSVDGQKFEYGHFTQKDIIRYLLEFSTHDIVVKGKSDEKPKKKTKSAMKSEYIQYYSQTSTSSSTTTAS